MKGEYTYRIFLHGGEVVVTIQPDYFMDVLINAIESGGVVREGNWLIKGEAIQYVKREWQEVI